MPVMNRTALVGSRYPVFVAAEYDDGPVHQAVVAQGIVAVVATESFFTRYRRFLWVRRRRPARPGWLVVRLRAIALTAPVCRRDDRSLMPVRCASCGADDRRRRRGGDALVI